jgi:hypothetical protein
VDGESKIILIASVQEDLMETFAAQIEPLVAVFDGYKVVNVLMRDIVPALTEKDNVPGLVILNFDAFDPSDVAIVDFIRKKDYPGPLIVIATEALDSVAQLLFEIGGVGFVRKPIVLNELEKLLRQGFETGSVDRRLKKRFLVWEAGEFQLVGRDPWHSVWVRDLSMGGARIESLTHLGSGVGELGRLRIKLSQMNRYYLLPCEIRWVRPLKDSNGAEIGLQFTGSGVIRPIFGK